MYFFIELGKFLVIDLNSEINEDISYFFVILNFLNRKEVME